LKSKVVIIADFVYPNYIGGSARYVYDLIKGFEYNKIDYLLITRKKSGVFALKEKDQFFNAIKENNKVIETSSLKDILNSYKLIKKNDILNIHHPILGFFYSFLKNKKIYFFHGPLHKEYKEVLKNKLGYIVRYIIQKFVLKRSNKVLVLSNYMRSEVNEITKDIDVCVIGPIFDSNKFKCEKDKNYLRKKYNISMNKKVLFTSRRLTNRTGVIEFVDLFKKYFDKDKFELIIVGKGELQNILDKKIINIDNIRFFNFVSDEVLLELMKLSDVYVLPTKELEGFGLVILEALSIGVPVIVSDKAGGGKEFIEQFDKELVFSLSNENTIKKSINYALNLDLSAILDFIKKYDLVLQSRKIYEELHS